MLKKKLTVKNLTLDLTNMQKDTLYNSSQCGYGPNYVDRGRIYQQVSACTFQSPDEYSTTPHEPRKIPDGSHCSINSQASIPSSVLRSSLQLQSPDSEVSDSSNNFVSRDPGEGLQSPATRVFAWMKETRQNTKQRTHLVHSGDQYTS